MSISELASTLAVEISALPLVEKVEALNLVRAKLHEVSPFKNEPTDLITWIKADAVKANSWNPNHVASPEMKLLELSIRKDGMTQPVVTFSDRGQITVVDGFHRKRVCSEVKDIATRLHGYIPTTRLDASITDLVESTVDHNRARGRHTCNLMADLIKKLIQEGCTDTEMQERLGMTAEEVLRLRQTAGAAKILRANEYARAWDVK
ncbi:MAG TPA: ParB N-terminal domain-containing protein [Methanotrichaceae archaeon]|nr:ParB N-terminal domain-containing protein [Methanotrichaceae archaeon]